MPLQPLGARVRSGPFAPDGACDEAALARPSGAATRLEPTGSTSASSPVASSPGAPSATQNRSGLRCRQVAFAPGSRSLVSPAARCSQATFRWPEVRLATAPPPPSMFGVSSPKAARDAGGATNWPGCVSDQPCCRQVLPTSCQWLSEVAQAATRACACAI